MATVGVPAVAAGRRTGPTLREPIGRLASALHCTGDLRVSERAGRRPVLLIHGTTSDARANFSWNWDRAFDAQRRAHCDVDLPRSGNGDIQTAAEYVVYAIRSMHHRAHGQVDLLGHSQGGMIGRWALKWWPGTRAMVDDYVSLAGSNHGTDEFRLQCGTAGSCDAADWQQTTRSHFLTALNAGPQTWPGVSYTDIATKYDEVVVPYTSAFLPAGRNTTNVTVQRLCPTETVDHFGMAYDNAAYRIGMDAITHVGPAKLGRIHTTSCGRPFMHAVDPALFPANAAGALAQTATSSARAEQLPAEPRLRCYVTHTCSKR
jgi:pimeloyl-ACP methyl ester carboxylesterase